MILKIQNIMGIAYIRYIQQAPEIARSQTMQRANGQRWLSKTISNTTCKADSCLKYLNHHELCSSAAGQEICSGLQFCENPCSWIRYTDRALGQWDWWAGARWPMGDGCSCVISGDHNRPGCHCQLEREKEWARREAGGQSCVTRPGSTGPQLRFERLSWVHSESSMGCADFYKAEKQEI